MTAEGDPAAAGPRPTGASTGDAQRRSDQAPPLLEWTIGGLGAVLVGGAILFLVYHSFVRDQTPPDVRVLAGRVLELQNGYLVQFRAFNQGGSAAAQVMIEGEIAGPDGRTEVSEAMLDYVPARSDREGGLMFSQDPRAGQLSLRAKGYARP
jgi:uncharacterized protein (TIGR02588 family)